MRLSLVTLALAALPAAFGSQILTRADLVTVLGGPGTLETFEGFSVAAGNAVGIDCPVLNSAAICNSQGPGLVLPGVNYTFGSGGGQWDAGGYFGSPSKEILSGVPSGQPLVIDFTTTVRAFGLDLRAFTGFPATATVTIFGTNDTTVIGTLSGISLSTNGLPVFAGWQDSGGIGKVQLSQSGQSWSPLLDNLQWGSASSSVPEPTSVAFVGLGLTILGVLRKRRIY